MNPPHLILPGDSRKIFPEEIDRQLGAVLDQLRAMQQGGQGREISFSDVERGTLYLQKHFALAAASSKEVKKNKNHYAMRMATINRLYSASSRLSLLHIELPDSATAFISSLIQFIENVRDSVTKNALFAMNGSLVLESAPALPENTPEETALVLAELREMANALYALSANEAAALALQSGENALSVSEAPGKEKKSILPSDIATNPVYTRFAFKALLATLICYFFYTGVQWDGIHTCMLTCIILALPGLGSTTQKAVLRIGGCLIGSAAALLATLFVIPHLDTLGGFMILSLPILGVAAWVNAGSKRSNYAGLQIGIAYTLAMFGTYGPSVNLVEIRDRLIGIIIGVIVSTVVYSLLWPEKESTVLKKSMADLLRNISGILGAHVHAASEQERLETIAEHQNTFWEALGKVRTLKNRVRYEVRLSAALQDFENRAAAWIASVQALIPAVEQTQATLPAMRGLDPILSQKADACIKSAIAYLEYSAMLFEGHAPDAEGNALLVSLSSTLDEFETSSQKIGYAQSASPLLGAMRNIASALRELSKNPLWAMQNILHEEEAAYA